MSIHDSKWVSLEDIILHERNIKDSIVYHLIYKEYLEQTNLQTQYRVIEA